MAAKEQADRTLTKNLSPLGAWAFAIGTSIGWGSLVVTNQSYLGQAGPIGSLIGMVVGAIVMLVISRNYAYLMNAYPDSGGAYTYSKEVFGHDHGFLTAWFLALTYLAILWANATSLPLFARYFLGNISHVGKLYTIFGYDVYSGEALLTVAAILLFALLLGLVPFVFALLEFAKRLAKRMCQLRQLLAAEQQQDYSQDEQYLPRTPSHDFSSFCG